MSEFEAPFILKISFNAPNRRGKANSVAHVKYIGTRPGVAFEDDMKVNENENIEELTTQIETDDPPETQPEDYAKYIGHRPGSHGLFSQDEDETINLNDLQHELKHHQGNVWKMILSLKEGDALKLGYTKRETWEEMLRSTVPDVANKMGIPMSNTKWVAAFHEEKDHPHVHLMLWEKSPERERGVLSKGERMDVRRIFVNEIYEPHRVQLYQEKTAERDIIRDLVKGDLSERTRLLKGIESEIPNIKEELAAMGLIDNNISPKITDSLSDVITKDLVSLSELMPDKGRIAFQYMSDIVKEESLRISDNILRSPELRNHVNKYLSHTEELTRHHAFNEGVISKARQNAYADLKKRVAQLVLKGAAESKRINFMEIDNKKVERVIKDFSRPLKKPEQDFNEDVLKRAIHDFKTHDFKIEETKEILNKWSKLAHLGKTEKEISDVIDRVYSNTDEESIDSEGIDNIVKILKISGYEKEDIFKRIPEIDSLEYKEELYKESEKFAKKLNNLHISTKDWKNLEKDLAIKSEYPFDLKETTELKMPQSHFKSLIRGSRLNREDIGNYELQSVGGWSAFCINVALKQSGVGLEERKEIVTGWLRNNGIDSEFNQLEESIKDESHYLKQGTWNKLVGNLNLKDEHKEYPWVTNQEWEFNSDKAKDALKVIKQNLEEMTQDNQDAVIKTVGKLYKNISEDNDEFRIDFTKWNQNLPNELSLKEEELNDVINQFSKRTKDIDSIAKLYDVKDLVQKTTFDYAKLLYSMNVSDDQVKQVIGDWNTRTKLGYSEEKLDSIIDKAKLLHRENLTWGRTTYLNKDDFKSLCDNLGVKTVYPYKSTHTPGLSSRFFKSIWKSIERANKQNEAQVKFIQKRIKREHAIEHGKIKEFIQEEELER